MIKKTTVFLFFILMSSLLFAQQSNNFVVLELFTSEGCSSCPEADKLLSEISNEAKLKNQNIYCLAYHVDYWNKLGWKDPFSKFQFTRRQENYSRVLPSKELYTPQMVVNGTTETVGSNKERTKTTIDQAMSKKKEGQLSLKVDSIDGDTAFLSWNLSRQDKNFVLQIAFTQNGLRSNVTKGENEGKNLKHDHVVRSFSAVNNPGVTGQIKFLIREKDPLLESEFIAFLQNKQNYSILLATRVKLK